MVASISVGEPPLRALAELLRPDALPDGTFPEERLTSGGLSWQRYLELDKALGDDRPGPRFYYLDGNLEMLTTSYEHERLKKSIGGLLELYFEHDGTEIMPHGQATMRLALKEAGAEPDESWCLGTEKEFPDLVLEIALTSGGINKLELYRRFQVPEVWIWRAGDMNIFSLRPDASSYDKVKQSRLLPKLDLALFEICVRNPSWLQARREFRAGLVGGKEPPAAEIMIFPSD